MTGSFFTEYIEEHIDALVSPKWKRFHAKWRLNDSVLAAVNPSELVTKSETGDDMDAARLLAEAALLRDDDLDGVTLRPKILHDLAATPCIENLARWLFKFPELIENASSVCAAGVPFEWGRTEKVSAVDKLCYIIHRMLLFSGDCADDGYPIDDQIRMLLSGCGDRIANYVDKLALQTVKDIRTRTRDLMDPAVALETAFALRSSSAAKRVLYGGKSISSRLKLSARWHRQPPLTGSEFRYEWPPVLPDKAAGTDITEARTGTIKDVDICVLQSSDELDVEGAEMSHCIGRGGYGASCARGVRRILSIRVRNERATASLLVTFDPSFRLVLEQFRGVANSTPSAAIADYVHGYLPYAQHYAREAKPEDFKGREVEAPNIDAIANSWRPFLPKSLRTIPARELKGAIEAWLAAMAYKPSSRMVA